MVKRWYADFGCGHTDIFFFFIIQRVKTRAIPCPHQPPTRGDNTVSVAQGGTATSGATKQLLLPDRVLRELYIYIYIYIYTPDQLRAETTLDVNLHFQCAKLHTENDAECSGHPNSAVVPENTHTHKTFYKLVLANRKMRLCEIAEELKISEGSVFTILNEHLSMRKSCSKWVLRLLTEKATTRRRFRVLFATVSTQHKGVFA